MPTITQMHYTTMMTMGSDKVMMIKAALAAAVKSGLLPKEKGTQLLEEFQRSTGPGAVIRIPYKSGSRLGYMNERQP